MVPPAEHHVGSARVNLFLALELSSAMQRTGSARVNLLLALEKLVTSHYLRGAKWTYREPHDVAKSWSKMVNDLQHRVPRNTYTCILQPLPPYSTYGYRRMARKDSGDFKMSPVHICHMALLPSLSINTLQMPTVHIVLMEVVTAVVTSGSLILPRKRKIHLPPPPIQRAQCLKLAS
jgi:hypothetical protein